MGAHEIAAVDELHGGHAIRCSCGWRATALARSVLVESWMQHRQAADAGAVVSLEAAEPEHRILASVALDDGYRIECVCGWLSDVHGDALRLFDAWERHCVAPDPALPS